MTKNPKLNAMIKKQLDNSGSTSNSIPDPDPDPVTSEAHTPEKTVNVNDFGIVGDGITDDTAAIQAASNAAAKQKEEEKFQHYTSARVAMRLITEKGKKIIFTGYEFLTRDEDLITYLDNEIEAGLVSITKGKLLTMADRDPMEVLKKKHIAEYKEQLAQDAFNAAKGITKNMGDTAGGQATKLNPMSAGQVAN